MSRSAGRIRALLISALCLSLNSCIFIKNDKPLNPRLLFTVGSNFLESAESVALKGNIDYRNVDQSQSGSFQLVMNHGDSLAMIVEGPLNIDVYRLIVADNTAYAWDRESDSWTTSVGNDKLIASDYGIESVSPDHFGFYIFPQFYLNKDLHLDLEQMTLSSGDYVSYIQRSGRETSFSVLDRISNLTISYSKRSDFGGGYYPSLIRISSPASEWVISIKIERIRLNPPTSSKIWERN